MSSMGSSHYYAGKPGETTEWQDILRAKGIIAPSEEEKAKALNAMLDEATEAAEAARDHYAEKTLNELDEISENADEEEERIVEAYRRARIAEIKANAAKNKFGRVYPLSRDDFIREVTDGSKEGAIINERTMNANGDDDESQTTTIGGTWVVVLLYKDGIDNSRIMEDIIVQLAEKFKAIKFMKIVSDQCIESFPDRNVPALLLYYGGVCKNQLIGLTPFGGVKTNAKCVEWVLSKHDVLKTELEIDPRKKLEDNGYRSLGGRSSNAWNKNEEDDEDD